MSFSRLLHTIIVIMWAIYWIFFGVPVGAEETGPAKDAPADKPELTVSGEGEKITMHAVDAALVNLVRMLADQAGMNVIIDPDVSGQVTASFKDVILTQALTMILETNGYEIQQHGDVARVLRAVLTSKHILLQSTPVTELAKELESFLSDQGKVIVHPHTNSLIVIDRAEAVDNIEKFIALVDLRERQVIIEAKLVEVSYDKRDQFGFNWDWFDMSMRSISNITGTITQEQLLPTGSGAFRVALGNNHFDSIFEALQTRGYVDLLSAPRITTVNNQEATVEITEDLPYIQSTTSIESAAAGASTTSTETVEFKTVGIKLTVLPQIGEDDHIRMNIAPEVSEAPTRFEGVPVVKTRKAKAIVLVRDGQTIVLGGLIREAVTNDENRVPILSSIPLIGYLFTSTDKRIIKVELLIFITPRIVDGALAMADAEQSKARISAKKKAFRKGKMKVAGPKRPAADDQSAADAVTAAEELAEKEKVVKREILPEG